VITSIASYPYPIETGTHEHHHATSKGYGKARQLSCQEALHTTDGGGERAIPREDTGYADGGGGRGVAREGGSGAAGEGRPTNGSVSPSQGEKGLQGVDTLTCPDPG